MNDQPRYGAFILMFARELAWSRAGVEIVTLQTDGGEHEMWSPKR